MEEGNYLGSLAERELAVDGHPASVAEVFRYWTDLVEANRDRLVEAANPDLSPPRPTTRHPTPHPSDPGAGGPPPAMHRTTRGHNRATRGDGGSGTARTGAARGDPRPVASATSTRPSRGLPTHHRIHRNRSGGTSRGRVGHVAGADRARGIRQHRSRRRHHPRHPPAQTHRSAPHPPSGLPAAPRRTDRQVHGELIALADDVGVENLRGSLSRLAQTLAGAASDARPRLVQHGDDYLDIMVTGAAADPTPGLDRGRVDLVTRIAGPRTLPSGRGVLRRAAAGHPRPARGGRPDLPRPRGRRPHLPHRRRRRRRATSREAILAEFCASAPMAQTLQIIVIGDLVPEGVAGIDHVRVFESWDDAAHSVVAWAGQSHVALETNAWPNTFVARGHAPYHDRGRARRGRR
ncbi:MAG: hypothetical protein U5R31_16640 [Acidimicrobiia bacterium]|nr:hypothetical protein [Acidimicrobiia bacterium]